MPPWSARFAFSAAVALFGTTLALPQNTYELPADHLLHARPRYLALAPRGHRDERKPTPRQLVPGFDSLTTWNGSFRAHGFDSNGVPRNKWYYYMVGNPPTRGGTTAINAPVVPVALDLLNPDGSVAFHYNPKPYILPTLQSPLFQNASFSSSPTPTQVTDAIQRAAFWSTMAPDWHTMLNATLRQQRTMAVPAGFYYYALKNGVCCLYVLIDAGEFGNLLFPASSTDTSTPIGAAENSGDITTKDLSTFLFPNTYLYFNGDPNNCCVVGYHTYDFEPGDSRNGFRERRYVLNYSSWVTPGLFGTAFEDVTALGHEIAETFNDPFVVSDGFHNLTPWWLAPNGGCQDALEVGDVVEDLADAVYPVKMNGRTYHPQNEALLPWFAFQSPSPAIHGAYSYPDEKVLTALSPVEKPGCAP